MQTRAFLGALAFLCALAFVVPAEAVTINGVDYALFARCKIGLENGAKLVIDGNVGVNEDCGVQNGFLHIGVDNVINGTASANRIFFGTGSKVTECRYNVNAGGDAAAVCGNIPPDPDPPGLTLPILQTPPGWPNAIPLPVPAVTLGAQDAICTGNLAPGNYKDIDVPDGATCTLSPGTYNARNVTVHFTSTLNGNGAALNLTGNFLTEPVANVNDTNVTSVKGVASLNPTVCTGGGLGSTAEAIETGNGATVNNSIFYAPCARMHLHQSGTFLNFEGIAVLITVEPVQIKIESTYCACIGKIEKVGNTIKLTQGCSLDRSENQFFVSDTCRNLCPGDAGCISASLAPPPPTDATATLSIPAVPAAGAYHVIVTSPSGQFCTSATVSLP